MKKFSILFAALMISMLCCAEAFGADIPNNEIHYTASEEVTPNSSNFFGAKIVSNTFADGKGTIIFDGDVTSIGGQAFNNCHSLTSITLPESVTSIGDDAFYYCGSLTNVNIPDDVTSIGNYAFSYCGSLTRIDITEGVTSIREGAFQYCTFLTGLNIPESVDSIGRSAFGNCSSLTDVTVNWSNPSEVTLGENIFDNVNVQKATLHVPSGTAELYRNAPVWKEFYIVERNDVIYYTAYAEMNPNSNSFNVGIVSNEYDSESGKGIITFDGDVTSIGASAFCGCSSLTDITLPKNLTSIGDSAFYECTSLTSFTIPASVTFIADYAFYGCSSLPSINIPEGVTSIGDYAFYGCSSFSSINIPEAVTYIGDFAFKGCTGLTSINIPNSVTNIGKFAFRDCSSFADITVNWNTPSSVTLGSNIFNGLTQSDITLHVPVGTVELYQAIAPWEDFNIVEQHNIIYYTASEKVTPTGTFNVGIKSNEWDSESGKGTITFDGDVTCLEEEAFYGCDKLTSITLLEGVTSIECGAFNGCSNLKSIALPASLTSIGNGAFDNCSSLDSISVAEGNTVYDSREGCNAIIETATSTLIAGCSNTVIPEDVKVIGKEAFLGCKLISFNIPESVDSIGKEAFNYTLINLQDITVNWDDPSIVKFSSDKKPFGYELANTYINTKYLYVPVGTVELYQNHEIWGYFIVKEQVFDLASAKAKAIKALKAIVGNIDVESLTAALNEYIGQINAVETKEALDAVKAEATSKLTLYVSSYLAGRDAALGTLPTEGTTGHGVRVVLEKSGQDDKVLELMNPTKVQFFKK